MPVVDPDRSAVRRFLLWWFGHPTNPYVSVNAAVDFTEARAYLARLARDDAPQVSVNHLLAAAIGVVYREFPQINARIVGNRIRRQPHVGLAMPVNLLGHEAGHTRELSMAVLRAVDTLSLREMAEATRTTVRAEREGRAGNGLVRLLIPMLERAPDSVVATTLGTIGRGLHHPWTASMLWDMAPVTTALTNPGAALASDAGMLFRGGAIQIPARFGHVGSLWGVAPVQDEVIAVDGVPVVRPMLPVLFVFDHRLIDGVLAGRLMLRLGRILQHPADTFGSDGRASTR